MRFPKYDTRSGRAVVRSPEVPAGEANVYRHGARARRYCRHENAPQVWEIKACFAFGPDRDWRALPSNLRRSLSEVPVMSVGAQAREPSVRCEMEFV